jgi:hypothetical protein
VFIHIFVVFGTAAAVDYKQGEQMRFRKKGPKCRQIFLLSKLMNQFYRPKKQPKNWGYVCMYVIINKLPNVDCPRGEKSPNLVTLTANQSKFRRAEVDVQTKKTFLRRMRLEPML